MSKKLNERHGKLASIVFLFLLSALVMLRQLVSSDYFSSFIGDTYQYTSWAWQFTESLKEGVIYPRWTPLEVRGWGSPTFILYPPLAFYLVALFNSFVHSIVVSMNIVKFIAFFLSSAGMFFLVKESYSEKVALLSASFYALFPYNIFEFYLVGTFASMISLIWFSPIMLFTYRYINNGRFKDILFAGACYGGLILTHLINAYMFTFVLASFVIYMSIFHKRLNNLIALSLIMFIGILISAAYIFPLIFEKQFVNLQAFIGKGGFNYSNFFILPDLTANLPSDNYWPGYYKMFIFYLFFFCILIALLFLQIPKIRALISRDLNAMNKFFIGLSLGSIFLLFGPSTFIWEIIPFFKYIQFPSRWLNITVFAVVFLSAIGFFTTTAIYKTRKGLHFIIAIVFLLCFLLDFEYIKYGPSFRGQELIPPVKAEIIAAEHLPAGIDIGEIADKGYSGDNVVIIKGEGEIGIIAWKSAERIVKVAAIRPLILRIKTFNFPGWTAFVDGAKKEIKTEEGSGAILVNIPKGKHTLVLNFVDTPIKYYSKLISLFSILVLSILMTLSKGVKLCKSEERNG